jgi:hypothetical protein
MRFALCDVDNEHGVASHRHTGHEGDAAKRFRDLETWTRQNLDVRDAAWRWVN